MASSDWARGGVGGTQTAARAILGEPYGFRLYGFSASLGPPSFAKEALSASRLNPILKNYFETILRIQFLIRNICTYTHVSYNV